MAVSGEKAPKSRRRPALLLCQGMQVAHQALQAFLHHMGIDLGARDIGLTKQRLNNTQISSIMQQMTGEGMPQHVRADQPRRQPRSRREFLQVAREMLSSQVSAFPERGEQPFRTRCLVLPVW